MDFSYWFYNHFEKGNSIHDVAILLQYYQSGIGGDALTNFTCEGCIKIDLWSNTSPPKYCYSCALVIVEEFWDRWKSHD